MPVTSTEIATKAASKYLQQLCKHFAHKVPAEFDSAAGHVRFPFGLCRMAATGAALTIHCEADNAEAAERMQAVIATHLERFAWREELSIDWVAA
ncbi:DUF2218 domain-containing protein [Rhodobium gokarnense]|uniref:2,4-dihydroxyhept-2-ene-1,7-dioic acid aldolase n=1 Tax=Rhodobium gokarnense TaxID=364296 RepID=A0ABT3HBB7_9HYPH|nr:DUF2218 domain-containing protein [Rhodobium gokarnense]MCW2307693.1 hypothetical protein [Rhodobium gokarnense]